MNDMLCYDSRHPLAERDFAAVIGLMESAFPESERRTKEDQRALLQNPFYRLTLLRGAQGVVAAFFAWWDFPGFRFGEHFAVDGSLRGKGVGGEMLDAIVSAAERPFVLEVEPPDSSPMAARRVGFYERHGFVLNPYGYVQPPLRAGMAPIPLCVMTHPGGVDRGLFEAIRGTLYREVYAWDK